MRNPRQLRTKSNLGTADDRWDRLQTTPPALATQSNAANKVIIVFQQVNGSAVVAHNTTTADVTVIVYALDNAGIAILGGAEELPAHDLEVPVTCDVPPGWQFAVSMGIVSSPHGSATGVRMWWQGYRA